MIKFLKKLFGKNRRVIPTITEADLTKEELEEDLELQKQLHARSREMTAYMQKGLSEFLYGK